MSRWYKPVFVLSLIALFLFAAFGAAAQQSPPFSKPYPMGQVKITIKTVAAGVGMEWGRGVLTYKGKEYTFKVKGIQVGGVGISEVHAKGDVYNLFDVGQFAGHYVTGGAGMAIFKGKQGQVFKNSKDVHIWLSGTEEGVALNVGPNGFDIDLQEAL